MNYYEKRLEQDEEDIRLRTQSVAKTVRQALEDAVHALLTGNRALANQVVLGDGVVNREVRSIDHDCHRFIVRHLPSAGHLRQMSATIRAVIALERVGDYAVSIGRVAASLPAPPDQRQAGVIENIASEAGKMLEEAAQALADLNAEQARTVMVMADKVERLRTAAIDELTVADVQRPVKEMIMVFVVLSMLERVSDQAKNLCEEAVFAATGETKQAKVFHILFLDREGSVLAPMTEAVARRLFPNSGVYEVASLTPTEAIHPELLKFLGTRGIDASSMSPKRLDKLPIELSKYHVIVSLQGPIGDYVEETPFHTATLEWDVGEAGSGGLWDYEALHRAVSVRLRHLMEQLRGPEAD